MKRFLPPSTARSAASTVREVQTKIDPKDLAEIVEETARLEAEEEAGIDREHARQILRELDLPAARLEQAEALVSARRQDTQRRAGRTKVLGVAAALLVVVTGAVAWRYSVHGEADARLTAQRATVSVGGEVNGSPVSRSARPEVRLDVVLGHVAQGESLDLRCDWKAPSGELLHQSRWQTRSVDKDVWPTHCRRTFGPNDPSGEWSVTMRKDARVLVNERFTVQ